MKWLIYFVAVCLCLLLVSSSEWDSNNIFDFDPIELLKEYIEKNNARVPEYNKMKLIYIDNEYYIKIGSGSMYALNSDSKMVRGYKIILDSLMEIKETQTFDKTRNKEFPYQYFYDLLTMSAIKQIKKEIKVLEKEIAVLKKQIPIQSNSGNQLER